MFVVLMCEFLFVPLDWIVALFVVGKYVFVYATCIIYLFSACAVSVLLSWMDLMKVIQPENICFANAVSLGDLASKMLQ